MNDLPISHGVLPHRPDPLGAACRYPEYRPNAVPQIHQQMAMYHGKSEPYTPPIDRPPAIDIHQRQQSISTAPLPLREHSPTSSGSSSPVKSGKEEYASQWCLCKPDPKIPRPRNAFILYRQHHQAAVVAHNPGLANPEISKIIGMQWRVLTEGEKNKWRALAEEEKARHAQQYPTYRYQPKRAGRDGNARLPGSGISHNPSGGSTCNNCGGRIMNAPCSPMTPFTPTGQRSSSMSAGPPGRNVTTTMTARSSHAAEKELQPIRIDQPDHRARPRKFQETGDQYPDMKRRRVSHASIKSDLPIHRNRSPESASPYAMSPLPYSAHPDVAQQQRQVLPSISRPFNGSPSMTGQAGQESSLKLAPLKTSTPVMAPLTPFSQDSCNISVEATVMTIPYLNKIKVLAKISPPLQPALRQAPIMRGPVISIDGQDQTLVHSAMAYLERMFKKEAKYHVRIFQGPNIKEPNGESSSDPTVEYLDTISSWHRVSDEVKDFVRTLNTDCNTDASHEVREDCSASPKTLIPKTSNLQINSPQTSDADSEHSASTNTSLTALPLALVPRYQLTTADAFACSIPIRDSYTSLDHWQWMASLWRTCVGPDITVYIRECSREELERFGGNAVEMRLQDARTIVIRKVVGSPGLLEEKALKRVGFEIEDFLTQ
ncbi:hypothetical protein VI817_003477 [Penicillium citrinum]|nr:hypothetical protein VI817_003477 [Penicillium citrinum]